MHFPDWLRASWFDELSAEIRQKNGKWKQIRARNEALDLWVYVLAVCWKLGVYKLDWSRPPGWAQPLDRNTMVISRDERKAENAPTVVSRKTLLPRRVAGISRISRR